MLANACELYRDAGFVGQPAAAVTSLAFVVPASPSSRVVDTARRP
jgi:hypothetical protein